VVHTVERRSSFARAGAAQRTNAVAPAWGPRIESGSELRSAIAMVLHFFPGMGNSDWSVSVAQRRDLVERLPPPPDRTQILSLMRFRKRFQWPDEILFFSRKPVAIPWITMLRVQTHGESGTISGGDWALKELADGCPPVAKSDRDGRP